jgi:threonine dehydratase
MVIDFDARGLGAADLREARERVGRLVRRTPLIPSDALSERCGRPVLLKCENLQVGGAFKARGASHFLARLDAGERARGVITYSSGNHAIAVATAARRAGVPAVVVMPRTAPAVKVERVKTLGAELHLAGATSLERKEKAEEMQRDRGLAMVPPFDHHWIIAGQATCGAEILEDWPEAGAILVPVGGGGLAAGIAVTCRHHRPAVRVYGVEPEGAAKMAASLGAGEPVTLASVASIADGLLPSRPGDLTFAVARDCLAGVITVGEAAIREAAEFLLRRDHLLVEFSGAVGVAALLSRADLPADLPVVVVLSGGNVDPLAVAGPAGHSRGTAA